MEYFQKQLTTVENGPEVFCRKLLLPGLTGLHLFLFCSCDCRFPVWGLTHQHWGQNISPSYLYLRSCSCFTPFSFFWALLHMFRGSSCVLNVCVCGCDADAGVQAGQPASGSARAHGQPCRRQGQGKSRQHFCYWCSAAHVGWCCFSCIHALG